MKNVNTNIYMVMKQLALLLILVLPLELSAQVDDLYFVPKKSEKKDKVRVEENRNVKIVQEQTEEDTYTGELRDEDEYNRRGHLSSYNEDNEEYYGEESVDDEEYTTVDENEIAVEEEDFTYSSRILRFHSPRMVMLSSPWYWDIVYTSGTDNWIICDDGLYWDVYPAYNYYSSWYYPAWSWHFSFAPWGFYSSYCWDYWHAPFAPWHHHHYYPYWGGHHHGYVAAGPGYYDNRRPSVIDMRSGERYIANSARGRTAGIRNRVIQSGTGRNVTPSENVQHRNETQNGGAVRTVVRNGRSGNTVNNATVNRTSDVHNSRGTTMQNRNTANRTNTKVRTQRTQSERKKNVQNSSSSNTERTYDRPSSTRTTTRSTNVERSSNNRNSSGSFSRGGSSRGGSGSIGGGSRGRRR